jgi:alpha-tubulin suppressor-like RCC1 family protein
VEKVLVSARRDTDGDGLPDAFELSYRQPGAALNPNDANEDHNGNGVPDRIDALRESYREGAVRGRPVLAAGNSHSLAIRQDGTLWGWGDNLSGQLGTSAFTETNAPTQIGTDTNWLAVSAANATSFGLKTDGTLWFWGVDNLSSYFTPTQIGTNRNWIALPKDTPNASPTALQADGTRWRLAGSFTNIQLVDSNLWLAVIDDTSSRHWSVGLNQTLSSASSSDGAPEWNSIVGGFSHALGLKTNGTLWAWAPSSFSTPVEGQLGLGTSFPTTPTQVGTDTWATVSAGLYFSIGIKTDGSLCWWGVNNGFVPQGSGLRSTNLPTRLGTNTGWLAVSAGLEYALALREDGTLWSFGYNNAGRLGNGTVPLLKEPTRVGADADWASSAIGNLYSLGVKSNGTLWAWGANPFGVLGVGDFDYSAVPRQVSGSNWIAVSGGGDHTVGLRNDGTLWVWGKHLYGANSPGDQWTNAPTQVGVEASWIRMSAGWQHSLAMKSDRSLWAWGRNVRGELGNGETFGTQNLPVPVAGVGAWTNFSAGYYASLGVRGAALYQWGGAVGSSGFPNAASPQQVGGSFNWRQVATAKSHITSSHALALKLNGTLWAWGSSFRGQLGTNDTSGAPVQVGTETNWTQIAVGELFSGALRADGTLWMTGYNGLGQLGLGTRASTNLFTRVGTATNWIELAAGFGHVLARQADGTLWAWGDNSYGQCAQPALFTPVAVAGTNWGRAQ